MTARICKAAMVAVLAVTLIGCANKAYVVHPGSPNAFDSQTYDILVTADAAIKQTKAQIAANAFTGTVLRDVSIGLNGLIDAYNTADAAYLAYHAAATANPPTASQAQVNDLDAKAKALPQLVANLNAAKGGK